MSSSGHSGFTWLHCEISPSAAGSHSVLSCSLVTSVAKSFCLLTTTEMPSKATGISMNSTPFSSPPGTPSARPPRAVLPRPPPRGAVEADLDLVALPPVLLAHRHLFGHVCRPGSVGDLGVA